MKNKIKNLIAVIILFQPLCANATLVAFEFEGLAHESSAGAYVPWGSFAGGKLVYDTDDYYGKTQGGTYLFDAPPVEFTFEIYKSGDRDILYSLSADGLGGDYADFDIQVYNGSGNSAFDALNYTGRTSQSLATLNGNPLPTYFQLSLGGFGALNSSNIPDYVPDLALFDKNEPQIGAWAFDPVDRSIFHLFTVRNLTFTEISINDTPVPLPGTISLLGIGSLMFLLVSFYRPRKATDRLVKLSGMENLV